MTSMRQRKQSTKVPLTGVVSKINTNNTYDIEYDDGEKEPNIKRDDIQVIDSGQLTIGSHVKVNRE